MSERAEAAQGVPGPLFAIGGAEDKLKKRTVLREFVAAAGGDQARIVVIPTASALGQEIVDLYAALFATLGAAEVSSVRPETRADAEEPSYVEPLAEATGIFMTGGNQLKLSGVVAGTAFGKAILAAHERGAAVGGTSAGASILAEHMIAFGRAGTTPRQRMTQLSTGSDWSSRRSSTSTSASATGTAGCSRWWRSRRRCSGSVWTRTPRRSSAATGSRWSGAAR